MSAIAPRMATYYAAQRQVASYDGAMLMQRLQRIGGATGFKPAGRSQPGTEPKTVPINHKHQYDLRQAHQGVHQPFHEALAPACISACSSARTAHLSCTEDALINSARENPRRKRTTNAACGYCCEKSALTEYICLLIRLRVTDGLAQRLGTMAPIHMACSRKSRRTSDEPAFCPAMAFISSPLRCKAKCLLFATMMPARTAWNCGRVLSRCTGIQLSDPGQPEMAIRPPDACGLSLGVRQLPRGLPGFSFESKNRASGRA